MEFISNPLLEKDIDYVASLMTMRWGYAPEDAQKEAETFLAQNAEKAGFIVYHNDVQIGCGLFNATNNEVLPDVGPWLELLWIDPAFRGHNLGVLLTQKRMEHARIRGYKEVYLDTLDMAEYHEKLGWQKIGEAAWRGQAVTIMKFDLSKEFPLKNQPR